MQAKHMQHKLDLSVKTRQMLETVEIYISRKILEVNRKDNL